MRFIMCLILPLSVVSLGFLQGSYSAVEDSGVATVCYQFDAGFVPTQGDIWIDLEVGTTGGPGKIRVSVMEGRTPFL